MSKETCKYEKRPLQTRPVKETCMYKKRHIKETCESDLHQRAPRKRTTKEIYKETNKKTCKRDLQKRPTKETYKGNL